MTKRFTRKQINSHMHAIKCIQEFNRAVYNSKNFFTIFSVNSGSSEIFSSRFRGQQSQTMERVINKISIRLSIISTSPHGFADLVFCF